MRATLLALVLLTPAAGLAQVERYELGRRLKRFEAEWERGHTKEDRDRALVILPKASTQFLSLNLTGAAQTVDDAYWALKSADPPAAGVRWLDALCVVPERRAVPVEAESVRVTVRPLYAVPGGPPAGAVAKLVGPFGAETPLSLGTLPATVKVSTALTYWDGHLFRTDRPIRLVARLGETEVRHEVGVSRLPPQESVRPDPATIDGATAVAVRELAERVLAGEVPETDLPLESWIRHVEPEKPKRFPERGGTPSGVWAVVPTGKDIVTPCRLFVPPGLTKDKPVPLVVALHGAGGSENMFFESYGAGHIVKECQKRGWLLVSPRSGLLGTPPVAAIVEKLAERYPIDRKRVFLVGHSMGAGQAIDLVQRHPGTFAAVASLGGGGRVRQKERFETLPVFVGVGTADFALRSSRALTKALADAGAARVTSKEYPDLEHLLIVREALPDVFRMFDGVK